MRCVPARDFTVAKALAWRGAVFDDPPYQRDSYAWSLARQQRFIDSLLNGYDVPKIYLHDLRGQHPTRVYAIVDGKQRLNAIWRFLGDELALADDFRIEPANLPPLPLGAIAPRAGQRFSELDPAWKAAFRSTYLSVVLIRNATEDDIEDLFARLNSGEPLTPAERRNARGGDMAALIREVAHRPFLVAAAGSHGARDRRLELAARIVAIEHADPDGRGLVADLRDRALDALVASNRRLAPAARKALLAHVDAGLALLEQAFGSNGWGRIHPGELPLRYLLARRVARADASALDGLAAFVERFERNRRVPSAPRSLAGRLETLEAAFAADGGVAE